MFTQHQNLLKLSDVLKNTSCFIKVKLPVVPRPKDKTQCFFQGVERPEYPPPFVSKDTIKALQVTIKSMIELVELLLSPTYALRYVLTAKFNQDCLEVRFCFGLCFKKLNLFLFFSGFLESFDQLGEAKINQPPRLSCSCSEC